MSEREHLFVYGTLRKDPLHHMYEVLAQHSDCVGEGSFQGRLFDLGEYPGAVPSDQGSDIVRGEVHSLRDPQQTLRLLDEYEGCSPGEPGELEFRRVKMDIFLDKGWVVKAWIYLYKGPTEGLRIIPAGDYLAFRAGKQPLSESG